MPSSFITLHGHRSSVVFELATPGAVNATPLWRHWGARLTDGAEPGWLLADSRGAQPSSFDIGQPLSIAPGFGVGWTAASALLAHRGGRDFSLHIDHCEVVWRVPGQCVVFQLTDSAARLQLDVTVAIDAMNDVLSLRTRLTNTGQATDAPLDVQWLAAGTLPLPTGCDTVRSTTGRWSSEFQPQVEALSRSVWHRQNRSGRTSHDSFPGAIVTAAGTRVAFGAQLAWSGNHQQTIDTLDDGTRQWHLGEWLAPGEVRLASGESLDTPELLAAFSDQGLDGLAASFHGAMRARLPWPGQAMRPRPVHLNTWEAVYFDHRAENLESLARAAADLGVERFVLDDGWFHGRSDDRRALGDWWPDAQKYPHGLAPLATLVNRLGMEFGLWVEPEMVNPDSDLHRAHPDWALQLEGRPLLTFRNQLVLDIARPEVADHVFALLDARLREAPIAYLKWDMNRELTTAGRAGVPVYRQQVLALYGLLDRVRAAHPDVEIESCASGGARIDAGVLAHTHRVWTSDCNDALSRVVIQRGFLQWFPPEIMGAHVGPVPAHTTGRTQSLAFRAAVALPGHFGVEADPRLMPDADRAELRAWIALHKQLRDRLHQGRVWQGDVGDGIVWQAHGDESPQVDDIRRPPPEGDEETSGGRAFPQERPQVDDIRRPPPGATWGPFVALGDEETSGGRAFPQERAHDVLVLVYRIDATRQRHPPLVRLPMLDPHSRYRLRRLDIADHAAHGNHAFDGGTPLFDAMREGDAVVNGAWLVHSGLPLPRMAAESCVIVRLTALPAE